MKRDIEYFIECSDEGREKLRLHEHEFYLSFNNDGGACAFSDWFYGPGKKLFEDWCTEHLETLSDSYG
jgi:hypothetical protein